MSGASDLFGGGDAIRQILLWSVVGQLVGPILGPIAQEMANISNQGLSVVPLSPAELALGVLKDSLGSIDPHAEAQKSGVASSDFDVMVANTGEPIAIQEALLLYRRGQMTEEQLATVVRQSRLRPEYLDAVKNLRFAPMSASEAVAAAVQAQLTMAEAQAKAEIAGLDPADFPILYNVAGRPPGIQQVVELVRRGLVPADGAGPGVVSLEQAIRESDLKDKWIPAIQALTTYIPPPRTVTALLRAGSITQEHALQLFKDAGLSQELAAAYVADASHTKVAAEKGATKAEISTAFQEKLITAAQATAMLEQLGYTPAESGFVLQLATLQQHTRVYNAAVTRVGTLFIGRKLEQAAASSQLDALGVPPEQRDELLTVWALERAANLRILSEAQVVGAWYYQVIGDDEALGMLQALGYTPRDSWILLAVKGKGTGPASPIPPADATHGLL